MSEAKIVEIPIVFDDQDSDDDMSREEWLKYSAEVSASGGYDVGKYKTRSFGMIIPTSVDWEEFPSYAKTAVDNYNGQNHTNFKFVELLKATVEVVGGFMFYITFKVEDGNTGKTEILQAKVWSKIPGPNGEDRFEIEECRIKPTTS